MTQRHRAIFLLSLQLRLSIGQRVLLFVVNPNATKYIISIKNPEGQPAACLEAVNANQLGNTDLAGEYTIQGNASEPWLMGNGYALPQYNVKGGSYFVDGAGVAQYITAGKIIISTAVQGDKTYSHSRALTFVNPEWCRWSGW